MTTRIRNGQLVDSLRSVLADTKGLDLIPGILCRVIDEGAWRDRVDYRVPALEFHFDTFDEFVNAPPLDGLGMTVTDIEAILKVRDEHEALRKLREVRKLKPGTRTDLLANSSEVVRVNKEGGTQRAYTLERLHRDRPDLHQQVLAGELTAHAAAIEAGFRKPTATVPVDSADSLIRAALRRFTRDELQIALDSAA